jgi:hypothetical protein
MTPSECEVLRDVLGLSESIIEVGRFWMMIQHDGSVILTEQVKGESPKNMIVIPRRTFHKFLEWYEREQ